MTYKVSSIYLRNTDPVVSFNSTYGNGRTTYLVRPKCDGSEGSFEMCRMDKLFKSSTCSVSNSVGVECKPVSAGKQLSKCFFYQ
jgi:hypothetical protein